MPVRVHAGHREPTRSLQSGFTIVSAGRGGSPVAGGNAYVSSRFTRNAAAQLSRMYVGISY